VQNLRLIVVDEEHEPAYKQDETPRYHGRDVAVMRAKLNNAVCLLGSATPSLESFHNAKLGRYELLELKQRVDDRKLPVVDVVDMKIEVMKQRGLTTLSRRLVDAMHARLERREQTILFINRRGYSSSMLCTEMRAHRGVSALLYHDDVSPERRNAAVPSVQRAAGGADAVSRVRRAGESGGAGFGPSGWKKRCAGCCRARRLERMDTDAMAKKDRVREILGDVRLGKIDILIGAADDR